MRSAHSSSPHGLSWPVRTASTNRGDLSPIRRGKAVEKILVAHTGRMHGSGLDRPERASRIDAHGDAVRGAEYLEPDVIAEWISARPGEDPERAVAEPHRGDGGVDVVVAFEPG